jgi:hypothetical protein
VTGSGWLELDSDAPIMAASRTYSDSASGTYGQYIDAVTGASAAAAGEILWLPQLRQDGDFRSNVGVLNNDDGEAVLRLTLFDASGVELASESLALEAGQRAQLQEPFANLAGRDDITAGYATVTVLSGAGITAYGSVIDNRSNDPTTIPALR